MDKVYYTIIAQGNVAGYPVQQAFSNVSSYKKIAGTGHLELTFEDETSKIILQPKDNESLVIKQQDGKLQVEQQEEA